jgi:hypothetical protein
MAKKRVEHSCALHAFTKLTPRGDRAPDDSGDWICKFEYPEVGREAPCPRCGQPTRWLNSVTVSPEGRAVRYFTWCSPLCRCPDEHIRKEIVQLIADALFEDLMKNGWPPNNGDTPADGDELHKR